MAGYKANDALLHLLKVAQGLGYAQHHTGMAHRVYRHGGGGYDKAAPGRHRQRDTDGVAAAQNQCGTGLIHPGDKLGQGEASFHITAHGVQNDQQAFDLRVLFNIHQLRDDVLILGGFLGIRGQGVALDGTDDGQAVDGVAALGGGYGAAVGNKIMLQPLERGALGWVEFWT